MCGMSHDIRTNHDRHVLVVDAIVVDRRLEQVRVLCQPVVD